MDVGERSGAQVTSLEEGVEREHRKRPCRRCPWRTDVDLSAFTDEDMEMLRRADGRPGAEAGVGAPVVACHLDQPGTAHPMRWCAGWLAVVGPWHLGIRLAVAFDALPASATCAGEQWPELHADLGALLQARRARLPSGR